MSNGIIVAILVLVALAGIGLFLRAIQRGLGFADAQAEAARARRAGRAQTADERATSMAAGIASESREPAAAVRAAAREPAGATATVAIPGAAAKRIIGKPMKIGDRTLPLSAGVQANGFLFLSGQLGTDAGFRLAGEDVEAQTRQALENVKALLAEAGCTLADVVKVTAFITEAPLSTGFNSVYAEYFPEAPPARSTVVSGLLLPGAVVEVEAIAALPERVTHPG